MQLDHLYIYQLSLILHAIGILRLFLIFGFLLGFHGVCAWHARAHTHTEEETVRKWVSSSDTSRRTRTPLTACVSVYNDPTMSWSLVLLLKCQTAETLDTLSFPIWKALLRSYQCSFDADGTSFGGFPTSGQAWRCLHALLCSAHTMPHCLIHCASTLPYCFNTICSDDSQRLSICLMTIDFGGAGRL